MSSPISKKELTYKSQKENVQGLDHLSDKLGDAIDLSSNNGFMVGIVKEVLSDPYGYFSREYNPSEGLTIGGEPITVGDVFSGRVSTDDSGEAKLTSPYINSAMADFVPANSIEVILKSEGNSSSANKTVLCMPFFSSHFMLPVKPGEHVWVMKFSSQIYYWMCRQTSFRQVEDVNYTHVPRESNVADFALLATEDENQFAHFRSSLSNSEDDLYEKIMESSVAYREEFTGETVPRNGKRCGDLLLQGSNNTQIQLGVEKFEENNTIPSEQMTDATNTGDTISNRKPLSPAIDICVFRKSRELFDIQDEIEANAAAESSVETLVGESHAGLGKGLGAVRGERRNARFVHYENEKARDRLGKDLFTEELKDSDIYNCIARIYMTNCKTIDDLLFTFNYAGENGASPSDILGLGNYGALALIGANTRLVGAETVKIHNIVGGNGVHLTPSGDTIIFGTPEWTNTTTGQKGGGARIVLEGGGDIRIIPGPEGVVKIGAAPDDEDFMFVPVGANLDLTLPNEDSGFVGNTEQIMTTAGGMLPTADPVAPPGDPVYATKVKIY